MALPVISNKESGGAKDTSKFLNKLLKLNQSSEIISNSKDVTAQYISKQDNRLEEKMLLRRISDNTDTIVDIIRKMRDDEKSKKDFFDFLKAFLPGLGLAITAGFAGLMAAIKPELTKEITTGVKAGLTAAKVGQAGAEALKTAALAEHALTGAKATSTLVHGLGTASKILGKIGSVADNKYVKTGTRVAGVGMIGGRMLNEDYTGAGLEAASMAASEAARKVKNPKAKMMLMLGSLATDAAIIGRDIYRANTKESEKEAPTKEKTIEKSVESTTEKIKSGEIVVPPVETKENSIAPALTGLGGAAILTAAAVKSGGAKIVKDIASTIIKPSITKVATEATIDIGKATGGTVAKAGLLKTGAKLLPGAGVALGAYGAYSRGKEGDYTGAAAEAVSGLVSLVPVAGTAIAAVIQGGLLYRDYVKSTSKDTGELNKITKESISNLDKSNVSTKTLIDENGKVIKATNATITKNSADMSKTVSETDGALSSFTKNLSGNLGNWLTSGTNIFASAVLVLGSAKDAISGLIGSLAGKIKNFFTGSNSSTGNGGVIDYKVDTKAGNYSLGKHGGTITGSIKAGESGGNYNVYNKPGTYKKAQTDASNTTLNQVIKAQDNKQVHAFGAYQIIGTTMKGAKTKLGLTGNEKMTPELQDKIFKEYLIKDKRPAIYRYITGSGKTNLNTAILAMAQEWASVGVPHDMKGHNRQVKKGESYYAGDGVNKASISPEEAGAGLTQQRERYATLRKNGMSEKDAYNKSFEKDSSESTSFSEKAGKLVGGAAGAISKDLKIATGSDGKKEKLPSGVSKEIPASIRRPGVGTMNPSSKNAGNIVGAASKNTGAAALFPASKPASNSATTTSTPTVKKDSKKDVKANASWDLDKLCSYAVGAAKGASEGRCALYVRRALEAAQVKKMFSGGLGDAKDYISSLPKIGWKNVGKNISSFAKGDIAVFPASSSKFGHVCIWTGSIWVSDFKQKTVQPSNSSNYDYYVFRAISGVSNGTAVGTSDDAKPGDITAGTGVDGLGSEATDAPASVIDQAINAAAEGLASIVASVGNSELVKGALDFVNSAKIDAPKQNKGSDVNMDGFEKVLKQQGPGYKYKYGNGGGIDEDVLFDPNLDRQKKGSIDVLGSAGEIPGIVRQKKGKYDILGDAGYIPGIVRQKPGEIDILGEAGSIPGIVRQGDGPLGNGQSSNGIGSGQDAKKKKLKWYQKLFGETADDRWDNFGNLVGIVKNTITQTRASAGLNELQPDYEGKSKMDGYISSVNKQYDEFKNPNNSSNSAHASSQNIPTGQINMKSSGKGDGLSAPLITRNPDSIFRAVSINMMKASTS